MLSPRMVTQLKWSRTVHVHGKAGRNVPCDLFMEHLNRVCKGSISGLGENISDKAVLCTGKCLGEMAMVRRMQYWVWTACKEIRKANCNAILEILNEMKAFTATPGRKHLNFPNARSNPVRSLSMADLEEWMQMQAQKLTLYLQVAWNVVEF